MSKLKSFDGQTCPAAFQSALDALDVTSIWEWDLGTDLARVDTFAALLFNLDPHEATQGLPLSAFIEGIHPDDQRRVHDAIRRSAEEKCPFVAEYRVCSADGSVRWVLDRGHTIRDRSGRPVRGRGILVDITRVRADGCITAMGEDCFRGSPLQRAAEHALAAQQAIAQLQDSRLKDQADALLLELGRKLAQQEVVERRMRLN